jgi:hypothetical protein
MHTPTSSLRLVSLGCAALALLLGSGCVTVQPGVYNNMLAYQPEKSTTRIDATAVLHINHTLSPEVRAKWKQWMNNDANIDNYAKAVVNIIANDIVESGIFTQVVPNAPAPDFIINITSEERMQPGGKLAVQFELLTPDQKVISRHARETALGMTMTTYNMKTALPAVMTALKADLLADLMNHFRQIQQKTTLAQAAAFEQAALPDLLVSADRTVDLARARNRALVAAKITQLPVLLRDKKTDELSGLVVKIEQTILDLNHESEVAKDRAQQAMANNGPAGQIDELRGLTISYRERIELLKPILAALKEEIANRNR